MTKLSQFLIGSIIFILALLFTFIGGCSHGKKIVKCPEVLTDTIFKYDTVTHIINKPGLTVKDTVIQVDTIPANIDTMAVIRSYFASNVYTREWQDSLVRITLKDTIRQNAP